MDSSPKKKPSITTRRGDSGETDLLYGLRVKKNHRQIEATGALDELSAVLGFAKATATDDQTKSLLETIQINLIALSGEIATRPDQIDRYLDSNFPKIKQADLDRLDEEASEIEAAITLPTTWALPGANLHEAALELARAQTRQTERRLIDLTETDHPLRPLLLQYINRLSDLLWLLARQAT